MDIEQHPPAGRQQGRPSWYRRVWLWALELTIVLILVLLVDIWLTRDHLHGALPAVTAQTLTGELFDPKRLQGQSFVVYFWATWCPVCRVQQGTIASLAAEVPLFSVAMQSGSHQELMEYLRGGGYSYPVINDHDGLLTRLFGVEAVPVLFIVDSRGKVQFVTRGYSTIWGLRVRIWLAELMAGSAAKDSSADL